MKIAMMTNNYKPFMGGVPISVERLSDSLRKLGHEVTVFAPSYGTVGPEETEGNVVRCRNLLSGVYGGFSVPDGFDPAVAEAFARERFDVIHVHHPVAMGNAALYLSRRFHVPLVFTYHTRYEQYLHYLKLSGAKRLVPAYIRYFAGHCDGLIAPSPGMKRYLEGIGITAPVTVLPTGLPEESFHPEKEKAAALRAELSAGGKRLFVCTARLAKEKNIDFLLESLALYKRGAGEDFVLALVGEGPQERHLRRRVREQGLEEEVRFAGRVENRDVVSYCAAADLFLFPSTSETQGIVSLEAMATGTPVLAVRATGTEDIVVDGKNGYMTEENSADFAGKLAELLADEKKLTALREGARQTARGYEAGRIARRALDCYRSAIEARTYAEKAAFGRNAGLCLSRPFSLYFHKS